MADFFHNKQTPFEKIVGTRTFVDKTLMIEKIQSASNIIYFSAPPRFGKTTNLDMIRMFFEITLDIYGIQIPKELTSNYTLFAHSNLAITRDLKMMKRFGTFFVVYIDCKCKMELETYTEMETFCREFIHRAYKQHEYLKYRKSTRIGGDVNDWCDGCLYRTKTDLKIREGLSLLIGSLKSHRASSANVMVLVDNFDAPLLSLIRSKTPHSKISKDDYDNSKELYIDIFKKPKSSASTRIMFSGTFRVGTPWRTGTGIGKIYEFLTDEKFTPFYGATYEEVLNLKDSFHVNTDHRKEIDEAYGGYKSRYGTYEMYNLHGVVNYLHKYEKSTIFKIDWVRVLLDVNILHFLPVPFAQKALWMLQMGNVLTITYPVNSVNILNFLDTESPDKIVINMYPLYLLQVGYATYTSRRVPDMTLTFEDTSLEWPTLCQLICPNKRIRALLQRWLFDYYSLTFFFDKNDILHCGKLLSRLGPTTLPQKYAEFRDALEGLFQTDYFRHEHGSAHLAFFPVACATLDVCEMFGDFDSKDVHLFSDEVELSICTHRGDADATNALRDANDFKKQKFQNYNPIEQIVLIGINIVPFADGVRRVKVDMKCELSTVTRNLTRKVSKRNIYSRLKYVNTPLYTS